MCSNSVGVYFFYSISLNDFMGQVSIYLEHGWYRNIHRLDMAYSVDAAGAYINPVNSTSLSLSIPNGSVSGNTAGLSIRITYPSGDASIVNLKAVAYPVVNGVPVTSGQPLETKTFNAQGIATFTTLKVGDVVAVYVVPTVGQTYLNNIVTASQWEVYIVDDNVEYYYELSFQDGFWKPLGSITSDDLTTKIIDTSPISLADSTQLKINNQIISK